MEIISIFIGSMALIIVIWQRLEIKALEKLLDEYSNKLKNIHKRLDNVDYGARKTNGTLELLGESINRNWIISSKKIEQIKALNDKVELLSNDSEAQEAEISTLIDTIITLRAEIEDLKPKLAQAEVEKSKDMQLAEQWENIINFNPFKDLEVGRGN